MAPTATPPLPATVTPRAATTPPLTTNVTPPARHHTTTPSSRSGRTHRHKHRDHTHRPLPNTAHTPHERIPDLTTRHALKKHLR
eukprot:146063-Prorocentrum_lima.AAC.1